jgi:hypothetical protein
MFQGGAWRGENREAWLMGARMGACLWGDLRAWHPGSAGWSPSPVCIESRMYICTEESVSGGRLASRAKAGAAAVITSEARGEAKHSMSLLFWSKWFRPCALRVCCNKNAVVESED